jgi:hypothetical protein
MTYPCANIQCTNDIPDARRELGYRYCLACGDVVATEARKSWTVLTPHKQGPMLFSPEFAREAAKGINNKGGLVK